MRDGQTKRLSRSGGHAGAAALLQRCEVRLVVVAGPGHGRQLELSGERHILGRGPGVDLQVDDQALSRQHAAFEYGDGGFRVRDLGSTNGVRVNERAVQVADLQPGDRIELGSLVLQYVVEVRDDEPEVYEIDVDA